MSFLCRWTLNSIFLSRCFKEPADLFNHAYEIKEYFTKIVYVRSFMTVHFCCPLLRKLSQAYPSLPTKPAHRRSQLVTPDRTAPVFTSEGKYYADYATTKCDYLINSRWSTGVGVIKLNHACMSRLSERLLHR